jgi:hypothetical protein
MMIQQQQYLISGLALLLLLTALGIPNNSYASSLTIDGEPVQMSTQQENAQLNFTIVFSNKSVGHIPTTNISDSTGSLIVQMLNFALTNPEALIDMLPEQDELPPEEEEPEQQEQQQSDSQDSPNDDSDQQQQDQEQIPEPNNEGTESEDGDQEPAPEQQQAENATCLIQPYCPGNVEIPAIEV